MPNQKIRITKDKDGWRVFINDTEIERIASLSIHAVAPNMGTFLSISIFQPDTGLELIADYIGHDVRDDLVSKETDKIINNFFYKD